MIHRDSIVVIRGIGQGGNGIVEEVWPGGRASEPLAMKKLREEDRDDLESINRFKREVRILQQLKHQNIIKVIDSELESDSPWFLMPLASYSLAEELRLGPLSEDRIQTILLATLDAIGYAHEQGVVHRDIKPQNILIMPEGKIVISDFGLGRRLDNETLSITRTGDGRGTEGYAAPEQWSDFANVNESADIFAIGSLLHEMVSGISPRWGNASTHLGIYRRIINRCRNPTQEQRYGSIEDLRSDLNTVWGLNSDVMPSRERIIKLLETASTSFSSRSLLLNIYMTNRDDIGLYLETIPQWSLSIIQAVVHDNPDDIFTTVEFLGEQFSSRSRSGGFNFTSLDDIARFLSNVYDASDRESLQELILKQLLTIGKDYNRFFLGRLFADKASQVRDRNKAMMFRDILRADPQGAGWVAEYVTRRTSDPIIIQGLPDKN